MDRSEIRIGDKVTIGATVDYVITHPKHMIRVSVNSGENGKIYFEPDDIISIERLTPPLQIGDRIKHLKYSWRPQGEIVAIRKNDAFVDWDHLDAQTPDSRCSLTFLERCV